MREQYEKRLFRLFEEAGYSPIRILTITPEEMVEIPGITVPISGRCCMCRTGCLLTDTTSEPASG